MASAPDVCSNHECDVLSTGTCVEGEDPISCPYRQGRAAIFIEEDDENSAEAPEDLDTEQVPELWQLRVGTRLAQTECGPLLQVSPGRVIAMVAPSKAGKTSLIAGIYELFLEGRATRYKYRDSATVYDFERISHLARAQSGRVSADMERTTHAEGLGYFHLELCGPAGRFALLLGDRPGETFLSAAGSIEEARELGELGSCSTIAILVDGAKLAAAKTKSVPSVQADTILTAVSEAGMLALKPALALVLTKTDLIDADTSARFDRLEAQLKKSFGHHFSRVATFRTAASPGTTAPTGTRGAGIDDLLNFLLDEHRPAYRGLVKSTPARSFGALGVGRSA